MENGARRERPLSTSLGWVCIIAVSSELWQSAVREPIQVDSRTSNAVIVAHQFNPSVVNQLWLVDNDIVSRDGFQEGCAFSDMVVNVNARDFSLFVSPEQLQFVPKGADGAEGALIQTRLGKFVQSVPHTPFAGLGLNFVWMVSDDDLPALSRKLFFRPEEPLFREFESEDARFGAYLSRDFHGGRLKLDIRPVTLKLRESGESVERLQFAFNLHFDVPAGGRGAEQICQFLENWDPALAEAERLMTIAGGVV